MKKLKVSFDKESIKKFFILNVEKMAFGLSMVGVAVLCYSAIQKTPYDKVPEDIEKGVVLAKSNIDRGKIDEGRDKIVPPNYEAMAKRAGDAVPHMDFIDKPFWSDNSRKQGSKRGEPTFLAVRELVGSAGTAPFAFIDHDALLKGNAVAAQMEVGRGNPTVAARGTPTEGGNRGVPPKPAAGGKKTPAGKGSLGNLNFGGEGGGEVAPQVAQGGEGGGVPGLAAGNETRGVAAPANSVVKGQQWVCITGLVPFKEQLKKYTAEFEKAEYVDPALDAPDYAGYLVERAEVPEGESGDAAKLKWTALQVQAAISVANKDWAIMAPEVVDPNLTHPNLTFPLGPQLGRNWDKDVAHPKIPVIDPLQRAAGVADPAQRAAAVAEETPTNDLEAFGKRDRSAAGPGGEGVQQRGPIRGGVMNEGGRGYGGRAAYGGMQGGEGGRRGIPGRNPMQGAAGYGAQGEVDTTPENLLFRFFDFTVQEGRRYRYRVRLALWNPNKDVRAKYLVDAKLATETVRLSDWSQPSPVISVTSYNTILVGPVKPADKVYEPRANVVVVQLDKELGVKAIDECREPRRYPGEIEKKAMTMLSRGQLLNYTANVDVFHPLTNRVEKKDIRFDPNVILLDLRGGEPLSANPRDKEKAPGEVLFLDQNGWLMVKSELEDEPSYLAETGILKALEDARASATTPAPAGGEGGVPGKRRGGEGGR